MRSGSTPKKKAATKSAAAAAKAALAPRAATRKKAAKKKVAKKKAAKKKAAKKAARKQASKRAGKAVAAEKRRPRRAHYTAKSADKYELYQHAVQSPDEDLRFLARLFKRLRGRPLRHLREDFCGTALLCAGWVKKGAENTAEGFDIDPEPLAWGIEHNFAPLGEKVAARATLHQKDVRAPSHRPPDLRCAHNFSYCCFKERAELLEYFRSAWADLAEDGVFSLDIHGGPESLEEMEEVRKIEQGFDYVWDQIAYWPATGEYECAIHFRFRDKTELKAFRYSWRLWTLPEVVDLLREAGFSQVDSYWEGADPDNEEEGDGIFKKHRRGENCLSWIAYIIAQR